MDRFVIRLPSSRDVEMQDGFTAQIPPCRRIYPSTLVTHNGRSVQFKDGSYMHIKSWKKDRFDRTILKGYHLICPTIDDHCTQLPDKELLWVMHSDNRGQPILEVERFEKEVVRNCRIILTNQPYEALSYGQDRGSSIEALYFCRWKRVLPLASEVYRKGQPVTRHLRGSFENLRAVEAFDGYRRLRNGTSVPTRISHTEARNKWRGDGKTILGGNFTEQITRDISVQQYTMGDAFCGAGGASQGALDAGLKIAWAFDMDRDAMATYAKRFIGRCGAECRQEECADFLARVMRDPLRYLVDVLHISPPCQPFSPANTKPNEQKNAVNHATFTTVEDLIRFTRPRIVTLEESHALEWPCHRTWFIKLISMFMSLGYSVRWGVLHLSEYGVPQTRTRLIMVASGPGESLPRLPIPTHGKVRGLHALPSIYDTIQGIPPRTPDHNPEHAHRIDKSPHDPEKLSGTIKCGGNSENVYHPSGLRHYTTCEMKLIQTFPLDYQFVGEKGSQSRQIGNAVPPLAANLWFTEVRKSLSKADEEEMASNGNVQ